MTEIQQREASPSWVFAFEHSDFEFVSNFEIRISCLLPVILLLAVLSGCGRARDINTTYGQRNTSAGANSANGTGVLAEMFKQAGHRVYGWRKLSPRVEAFDTIVWAPNDFAPPSLEQREYLENWLAARRGRTLVYIGRDYDAGPVYWRRMQTAAPPEQSPEIARRLAAAQADSDATRARMPKEAYARWFTVHGDGLKRDVRTLEGPWSEGVDASEVEIMLEGRLDAPQDAQRTKDDWKLLPAREDLLSSQGDALVVRVTDDAWYDSRVIVVTNGSFLLNLPLVNREHRKLAARLVEECGQPGKALFLESERGGPPISKKEAGKKFPTGFEWLTVWPISAILMHVLALGIVYIVANFAAFGRPRELRFSALLVGPGSRVVPLSSPTGVESEAVASADFGKHLQYLGDLLERTQDHGYAHARLQYYHEHVKRESGVSHAEQKKPPVIKSQ